MISRSFAWIDDDVEHSESDTVRATALATKWSSLQTAEENRSFRRQADRENGYDYEPDFDTEEERVEEEQRAAAAQAEIDLEIELVEDKLAIVGARMMRPYEHHHEHERIMEYMETRFDCCY